MISFIYIQNKTVIIIRRTTLEIHSWIVRAKQDEVEMLKRHVTFSVFVSTFTVNFPKNIENRSKVILFNQRTQKSDKLETLKIRIII